MINLRNLRVVEKTEIHLISWYSVDLSVAADTSMGNKLKNKLNRQVARQLYIFDFSYSSVSRKALLYD
jgi:hypothetical protein